MRRLLLCFGLLATGCVGVVGEMPEPGMVPPGDAGQAPLDAGDAGAASPVDGGAVDAGAPDAGSPDAGPAPDAGGLDAGFDAGNPTTGWDGGVTFPGLPASCQGLKNRTHGLCADGYANPNYGSIAWALKAELEQALAAVGKPAGYFNGDEVLPNKRDDFAQLVVAALDTQGICAAWAYGELYARDRLADTSETFSLFTGAGRPRAGGHWQCSPSDEIPGSRPGFSCSLTPSSGTCGNSGQNLFSQVVTWVEEVINEEQPKGAASAIIDFNHKSLHVRGWRLKDDGYPLLEAVARRANALGYCISSNGWKSLSFKKVNSLSETYSLITHQSLPDPNQKPALYAACLSDGILPSCEFIIEKGEETCQPAGF